MAQSVMITDFFNTATAALSYLGMVTNLLRIMAEKAKAVEERAKMLWRPTGIGGDDDNYNDWVIDDGDGDMPVRHVIVESAVEAVATCESAKNQMEYAQATITQSKGAKTQVAKALRWLIGLYTRPQI